MAEFVLQSEFSVDRERLYAWHAASGAFERLVPPWQRFRIVDRQGGIEDGSELKFQLGVGPFWIPWHARHKDHIPNEQFRDELVSRLGLRWAHLHRFEGIDAERSRLIDRIEFELPFGPFSKLGADLLRRQLQRIFAFRHRRTALDLERHARQAALPRQTVAISGATGLLGTQVAAFLSGGGHRVMRLVRRATGHSDEIHWDPLRGVIEREKLAACDAVIHLAGENIAAPWTGAHKARVLESRVRGTQLLAKTLAEVRGATRTLVSASAIGYYGDRDQTVDESSSVGAGFLAEVCKQWEAAADPARQAGLRVVHPRIGVVISGRGGPVALMKLPFSLGLGGPVGSGRQWISWISLEDLVGIFQNLLTDPSFEGPVNIVAPHFVAQREFAATLARVLHRPAFVPLPALAVRTMMGEMGQRLLLDSQGVIPARLQAAQFPFVHPELEAALRWELGR